MPFFNSTIAGEIEACNSNNDRDVQNLNWVVLEFAKDFHK